MRKDDEGWLAYIDAEVKAVCEAKGWGHQIRRRWEIRDRPVSSSSIDDYEWKLIPDAQGDLGRAAPSDPEGIYYVLRFDKSNSRFIFQHDTARYGIVGPPWDLTTYTEIRPGGRLTRLAAVERRHDADPDRPPAGWLRGHLLDLTARFKPNMFFAT